MAYCRQETVILLLENELGPEAAARAEEHLATCSTCRALYDKLVRFANALKQTTVPELKPHDLEALRKRILSEASLIHGSPAREHATAEGEGVHRRLVRRHRRRTVTSASSVGRFVGRLLAGALLAVAVVTSVIAARRMTMTRQVDSAMPVCENCTQVSGVGYASGATKPARVTLASSDNFPIRAKEPALAVASVYRLTQGDGSQAVVRESISSSGVHVIWNYAAGRTQEEHR